MKRTELEERLCAYLRLREALGAGVGNQSKILENFVEFAGAQDSDSITSRLVFDWLDATVTERRGTAVKRLSIVRQFLLHLSSTLPATQIPEMGLLSSYKRPAPFVFTPDEIELLLDGAAAYAPGTFFSVVLNTILGLISAAGLRASEAVGLDRSDVMLQDDLGTLLIRESKFHKSRFVPLHPSTVKHLADYAGTRDRLGNRLHTGAFFVSGRGRRLSYDTLRACFRIIVDRIGIQPRYGNKRPTLHSLRHSFVVARLRSWHDEGVDVQSRLAHLATYLGHVDPSDTYWYMTATPELLSAAAADFTPPDGVGGDL